MRSVIAFMQLPFFVYGTLRPGEGNYAHLLAGRTAAEQPAQLAGAALYDAGPYPFLAMALDLVQPADLVHGTLISVAPELYAPVLAALDELEGYVENGADNWYERVVVGVSTQSGPRQAYLYVAGEPTLAIIRAGQLPRIASGDWQARRG